MNILVTGGAGYVGSVTIPELVNSGHNVKCLDRFFFGMDYLSQKQFENKVELIKDDIRTFEPKILDDVDVVMVPPATKYVVPVLPAIGFLSLSNRSTP